MQFTHCLRFPRDFEDIPLKNGQLQLGNCPIVIKYWDMVEPLEDSKVKIDPNAGDSSKVTLRTLPFIESADA